MRIFDGRLVLGGGMEVDGGLQCLSGGLLFGTRGVGVVLLHRVQFGLKAILRRFGRISQSEPGGSPRHAMDPD